MKRELGFIKRNSRGNTYLFPIRTSGEQYSIVPQNVQNFLPSSMYAADPKSINLTWNFSSKMIFSSCN